jgi:hypothetical protein
VDAEPLLPAPVRREEEREPLRLEERLPRLDELPLRLDEPPLRLDELPPRLDELPLRLDEPPPRLDEPPPRLDEPLALRDREPALEDVPLRTPRTAPRATPPTTSPALIAPATPRTAPRRSVSRVRGENTAAVAAATNADSVLNTSSSAKVLGLLRSLCDLRYPARLPANGLAAQGRCRSRTSSSSPGV